MSHSYQPFLPAADARLAKIEKLVSHDIGRNISALAKAVKGDFGRAVSSIAVTGHPRVVIVTGFFIPDSSPPAPETDGLTGSVHLAAGLLNAGTDALILTDHPCAPAIGAAAKAIDLSVPMMTCGTSADDVAAIRERLLRFTTPVTHLISIERLGPSASGKLLGQFGFDFSNYMAPFHRLFVEPDRLPNCVTIAVGDGGNEIGMGKLSRKVVSTHIEGGERIHCTIASDHLIVCGVSNWGGPALLGGLAVLKPALAQRLLAFLNESIDFDMLNKCVHEGPAVDGWPEKIQMSIDGLPWEYHWNVLSTIRSIATECPNL